MPSNQIASVRSTVVEMLQHAGEPLMADRANDNTLSTFLANEVAATALNWFQHNLKANWTLKSLKGLLCLSNKQVLLPFVREREV